MLSGAKVEGPSLHYYDLNAWRVSQGLPEMSPVSPDGTYELISRKPSVWDIMTGAGINFPYFGGGSSGAESGSSFDLLSEEISRLGELLREQKTAAAEAEINLFFGAIPDDKRKIAEWTSEADAGYERRREMESKLWEMAMMAEVSGLAPDEVELLKTQVRQIIDFSILDVEIEIILAYVQRMRHPELYEHGEVAQGVMERTWGDAGSAVTRTISGLRGVVLRAEYLGLTGDYLERIKAEAAEAIEGLQDAARADPDVTELLSDEGVSGPAPTVPVGEGNMLEELSSEVSRLGRLLEMRRLIEAEAIRNLYYVTEDEGTLLEWRSALSTASRVVSETKSKLFDVLKRGGYDTRLQFQVRQVADSADLSVQIDGILAYVERMRHPESFHRGEAVEGALAGSWHDAGSAVTRAIKGLQSVALKAEYDGLTGDYLRRIRRVVDEKIVQLQSSQSGGGSVTSSGGARYYEFPGSEYMTMADGSASLDAFRAGIDAVGLVGGAFSSISRPFYRSTPSTVAGLVEETGETSGGAFEGGAGQLAGAARTGASHQRVAQRQVAGARTMVQTRAHASLPVVTPAMAPIRTTIGRL